MRLLGKGQKFLIWLGGSACFLVFACVVGYFAALRLATNSETLSGFLIYLHAPAPVCGLAREKPSYLPDRLASSQALTKFLTEENIDQLLDIRFCRRLDPKLLGRLVRIRGKKVAISECSDLPLHDVTCLKIP